MSKLFPNYIIDLEKGTVYSKHYKRFLGKKVEDEGYYRGWFIDLYGNEYWYVHQVIYAEGSGIPKHLWPLDEKGKRYEVDHIIPVKNGGTDIFENLRLVSKKDNCNNEQTIVNYSNSKKGIKKNDEWKKHLSESHSKNKVYQYSLEGKLIKEWESTMETEKEGFNESHVSSCCNGKRKTHRGYKWSYKPL